MIENQQRLTPANKEPFVFVVALKQLLKAALSPSHEKGLEDPIGGVSLGRLEGGDPSLDVGRLGQEASERLEVRYCRVLEIAKVGNDRVEDFDEGRCVEDLVLGRGLIAGAQTNYSPARAEGGRDVANGHHVRN